MTHLPGAWFDVTDPEAAVEPHVPAVAVAELAPSGRGPAHEATG